MNQMIGKPPLGLGINWTHPLSRGLEVAFLMNESAGNRLTNLVNFLSATLNAGYEPSWTLSDGGSDLQFTPHDNISYASDSGPFLGDLTVLMDIKFVTTTEWGQIVIKSTGNSTTTTPFSLGLYSSWPRLLLTRANTDYRQYDAMLEITLNKYGIYGFTSKANIEISPMFYLDKQSGIGVHVGGSGTGSPTATVNPLNIGAFYDHTYGMSAHVRFLYIWSRILTPFEIQQIHIDPYCFIQPIRPVWLKQYAAPVAGIPKHWDYYRQMRARA